MEIMQKILFRAAALALTLSALAAPRASAQSLPESVTSWLEQCRDQGSSRDGNRARHCEVRASALPGSTESIALDGRLNGGARFIGWDRDSIAVFALVQAHARTEDAARDLARDITISTRGGRIGVTDDVSTGRNSGYSVSYHVYVPRRMDIDARTHNGGITVDGVSGTLELEAHNGGLTIRNAGGDLRGRTTNGGITLVASGSRWDGRGVDLQTRNGGVTVTLPEGYNAQLETATVNGRFEIDFPIVLQGRIGRNIDTTLGNGGPLVRVVTTNGGVRIRRS